MQSSGRIIGIVSAFLATAVLGVGSIFGQQARADAVALEGDFRPPPPGTRFDLSSFEATIKSVGKFEYKYKRVDSMGSKDAIFTSLFVRNPRGSSKIVEINKSHEKLWPLRVGNSVKFYANTPHRIWEFKVNVLATEVIQVPTGQYFTYKLEIVEEGISHRYSKKSTYWYSPLLGVAVKGTVETTKGWFYGLTEDLELVSFQYPSESAKKKHQSGSRRIEDD